MTLPKEFCGVDAPITMLAERLREDPCVELAGALYTPPPLRVARLLFELEPQTHLYLPLEIRGNVLRGAFGTIFQRVVSVVVVVAVMVDVSGPVGVCSGQFSTEGREGPSRNAPMRWRNFRGTIETNSRTASNEGRHCRN